MFLVATWTGCRSDEETAALATMEQAVVRAQECVSALREHGGDMTATLKALARVRRAHFDEIFEYRRIRVSVQEQLSDKDREQITGQIQALHSEAMALLGKYTEEERKTLAFTLSSLQ